MCRMLQMSRHQDIGIGHINSREKGRIGVGRIMPRSAVTLCHIATEINNHDRITPVRLDAARISTIDQRGIDSRLSQAAGADRIGIVLNAGTWDLPSIEPETSKITQ